MFNKNKFAQILKNINETYSSQRDFSKKSEINRTYLSQYMNMKLDEPPKPKILEKIAIASNKITTYEDLMVVCGYSNISFYMCPVYSQISSEQPNWVEENIEGRIPIATNLMNIVNPEEHFFLHVTEESMNKVVKNGAFALIHKQEKVENGEIAVVLVNGSNATIRKFTKQGDLIVLEPQSNDTSFETQVYDKNTSIKILGKYIGKMEINK